MRSRSLSQIVENSGLQRAVPPGASADIQRASWTRHRRQANSGAAPHLLHQHDVELTRPVTWLNLQADRAPDGARKSGKLS